MVFIIGSPYYWLRKYIPVEDAGLAKTIVERVYI
jgi:hypothetical protein